MRTTGYARSLAAVLLSLQVAFLAGCASTPKPAVVKLSFEAAADLNPDARGRPSPIVLRFLELKSLASFESADFFSLYDRDKETLGAELLAREEFHLSPNDQRKLERKLQIETRYVGVIAAFRDLERATWRAAVAVPPEQVTPLAIKLDARVLSIKGR